MNIKSIMPKVTDFLLKALYYMIAWSICMAFVYKVLGLW